MKIRLIIIIVKYFCYVLWYCYDCYCRPLNQ